MDTNTKIIILVLILVFIKFFIPNIDNFDNTTIAFTIFNPTFKVYLQRINSDTLVFTPDKEKASYFYINNNGGVEYSTSSVIHDDDNGKITNNGWTLWNHNNKMQLTENRSSTMTPNAKLLFNDRHIYYRSNQPRGNIFFLAVGNNYSYNFINTPQINNKFTTQQLDNNNSIDFEKIYE